MIIVEGGAGSHGTLECQEEWLEKHISSELCWGKAMVSHTKPQQRKINQGMTRSIEQCPPCYIAFQNILVNMQYP